jgi:two-component system, NarL family, sensor histidine kinase DevS
VTRRLKPDRIAGLVEGAASVAGQVELSGLLRSTVEIAMELTGARYGALGVLGEQGNLVHFIPVGMDDETAAAIPGPPKGLGVLGTITRAGRTIRVDDVAAHPDAVGFPEGHPPMRTFLGVPVRVGDGVFGNLYLADKEEGFTEEDETLVEFLAVTAGSAVSTLRLQERLRRAALLEERERIARDLHDSIIQDLFAVGLNIQAQVNHIDPVQEEVRRRLDEAVEKLDETISALRRFIFDLRPPVWARPSLRQELADLVGQLAGPYQARVALDVTCPPDLIPPHLGDDLIAVVKEALSNALRHSGARDIDVRVDGDPSRLVVSVADDGHGFDPARVRRGMGLANMATRVEAAGGSFTVDSAHGRGTVVRAAFPL